MLLLVCMVFPVMLTIEGLFSNMVPTLLSCGGGSEKGRLGTVGSKWKVNEMDTLTLCMYDDA